MNCVESNHKFTSTSLVCLIIRIEFGRQLALSTSLITSQLDPS